MAIVAIEIHAVRVFTPVQRKTTWIQAGTKPEVRIRRPAIFPQQLANGLRAGGFIAMDAGRDVEPCSRRPDDAAKRKQIQFIRNRKLVDLPAEFSRGIEIIAQDLIDINGLSEVTAFVPA